MRWFLKRIFLRNSKNKKVVPEIKNENEIHSNIVATMMQNRSSILKSGTKNIFLIELANSFSHELHKTYILGDCAKIPIFQNGVPHYFMIACATGNLANTFTVQEYRKSLALPTACSKCDSSIHR